MRFFLGTHRPGWLARVDVPLFVSRTTLEPIRRRFPRARGVWALDSGAFTEVGRHGRWTVTAEEWARDASRYVAEIGPAEFVVIQDWMCEPAVLAKTGLTVADHQALTLASYLRLADLAPELPWLPVLQGWDVPGDYLRHAHEYQRAGVELDQLFGVGSVCKRQNDAEIGALFERLAGEGLRLHGFGVKIDGLAKYADCVASVDSMAWSLEARWDANHGIPSCDPAVRRSCSNCLHYALEWRDRVLDDLPHRLWEDLCAA